MKKLTVLCDLDDVLLDLLPHWVYELNQRCVLSGIYSDVKPCGITDWDIAKFFPSLTKEEVFTVTKKDGFWESIKPTEDGPWFIKELQAKGHIVKIVTASCSDTLPDKMRNFFILYPKFSWKDVTVTSQKQYIIGDALIDDAPHNLMGGKYEKILLTKPHNMSFDANAHGVNRVGNLAEALSILERMESKGDCAWKE